MYKFVLNKYTRIDGVHPKVTHFKHTLGCTFFEIPITHTQSMFFVLQTVQYSIHSMGYFCEAMGLYADEWKLTFLCTNQLEHYIIYFYSTLRSFATSQLLHML